LEPQEYDELIRHLVRLAAHQDTTNAALRESIQALARFNARQLEINEHVHTTLARLETLLARMIPQSDNGRDA